MVDLKQINLENQVQRDRLRTFTSSLTDEQLLRKLPNGWTVAVTLAHLAFWDERISTLFQRLFQEGASPSSIDADAVNGPLAILCSAIPPRETVRLALEAAEKVDQVVANLPKAVVDQFVMSGKDAYIRRSLHRIFHLEKIQHALKAQG
jgi:hypothetical protein